MSGIIMIDQRKPSDRRLAEKTETFNQHWHEASASSLGKLTVMAFLLTIAAIILLTL